MATAKKSAVKRKNSSTGYRGVTKVGNLYVSQINYKVAGSNKRKTERIGTYKNAVDAAEAYDVKAIKIHGDKAKLNFPAKKS